MARARIAVTVEAETLRQLDRLVAQQRYPSRSQAVESAITEQLSRLQQRRSPRLAPMVDPEEKRTEVDALDALIKSGAVSWSGGKPHGHLRAPKVTGTAVADAVIEDRR